LVLVFRMLPRHQVELINDDRSAYIVVHDRWTGSITTTYAVEAAEAEYRSRATGAP
jgi:hypothetical protein